MSRTTKVLVTVEWYDEGLSDDKCSYCGAWRKKGHASECDLDAELTDLGYPDQTSRDEARKVRP